MEEPKQYLHPDREIGHFEVLSRQRLQLVHGPPDVPEVEQEVDVGWAHVEHAERKLQVAQAADKGLPYALARSGEARS